MAELRQYNVSTDYALIDAGYLSEDNVTSLCHTRVPFVTRLTPKRKIFKKVAAEHLDGLISARCADEYGNHLLYMKKA